MRMTWGSRFKGGRKRYKNRFYPNSFKHAKAVQVLLNGLTLVPEHDYIVTKRYVRLFDKTTRRDDVFVLMAD